MKHQHEHELAGVAVNSQLVHGQHTVEKLDSRSPVSRSPVNGKSTEKIIKKNIKS